MHHKKLVSGFQALHICIALLERRQAPQGQAQARGAALRQSVERAAAASAELDSKLEADAVACICQHSARFAALLDTSNQLTQLVSASGSINSACSCPAGRKRLLSHCLS